MGGPPGVCFITATAGRLLSWLGHENTLLPRGAPDQACRHGRCPPLSARPGHLLPTPFQVARVQPAP